MIRDGVIPGRLLTIFDELTRIYKRSTYLLENGEHAEKALTLAREAMGIIEGLIGGRK